MERNTYFQEILKSHKKHRKVLPKATFQAIEKLCAVVSRQSQFFRLPENGIDTQSFTTQLPVHTRPPFPITVIEYAVSRRKPLNPLTETLVPKRVIIAFEEPNCTSLFAFWFFEEKNIWLPAEMFAVLPLILENEAIPLELEHFIKINESKPLQYENYRKDFIDEVRVYLAFIIYLNSRKAAFVKEGEVHSRNQMQRRPGLAATYQYHVLNLKPTAVAERAAKGGTHASPVRHMRRGHWRKTKSGSVTWVKAMMVGKEGFQDKDYRVVDK
jgi:hypothetical protein